uniref:Peptidase M41 domain-containing protein n=1 Tax=Odontella aurita TaxID=265563 RepID=A0A7S4MBA1_9STRA|mmetsp:Transcript_16504/g.47481  ORF Transcript_16504/g.47481 Transcript_16504/m.47481 type:complete len:406 (+) Transcript_16504:350-1567(+)|eukprot:CAMPEP_0113545282 /NCGR_PEP_ID=MMETSP0015_2-20120614/11175_1 /TAXON_ID=2838 /ORGANISM="Odontella" /LENGTH=405 /DNA_ID=CAMNT_0000445631 /DNA_START=216 /DNA_END=1433 /DNA_ORIENTATION=- /assembly_acc=CAM_ASM_000160
MSTSARIMKSSLVVLAASAAVEGFVSPVPPSGAASAAAFSRGAAMAPLRMSSAEDEVAKLRAKAQKAREEAAALAKEMGKDIETDSAVATKATPTKSGLSKDEASSLSSSVDFDGGDASSQAASLDAIVESGDFALWKAAATGAAGTSSQAPLRPYPVSLNFLEQRSGGKLTGESLGVSGEMDVSLDDFKDATIAVTLGSTVAAIASLALLPENVGATLCYLFALIPVGFIGIGSTAPGIIAGAISSFQGTSDDQAQRDDRICRHEAGHFLCGYLCGLPVKQYSIVDTGFPCVEFHPSAEGEALGREFTSEEIAALSVVAMSGSVAEVLSFGQARGGENDLLELNGLMRRSKEFIGAQKEQDLTRWGALAAFNLIQANMDKYEALVQAFKEKKSVADCVAAIEAR